MPKHNSPVERAAQAAWKPQDIREPWEWCEDNVDVDKTSPMPGKWRSANGPWVKEFMEIAANKMVSFIAVKCSAQSSKTLTLLLLLLWLISEDPGPTMYVMANKEDAEDFVRDRFSPMVKDCKPVDDLKIRETKLNFTFRTMPLYFVGAGSPAKLQGKPIKNLFLDEVRNYPKGALPTVMKRVRAFGQLARTFVVSTPGVVGDAVDQAFNRGDQRTFHFPCPQCATMQQLKFEQLKAEHPETHLCVKWSDVAGVKSADGQWNYEVLGKALRFQCFNSKCGHLIADTPKERKTICRSGSFIRMNPGAESCDVSFTWNALLPWWVPWKGVVKEFIEARAAARKGDIEPMKTFVTETLAESWEDRLGVIEDFGFLELRKAPYDYGEVWPEGRRRLIAADKQEKGGEHYPWVVREFAPGGKSRLVSHGTARTLQELEATRKEYLVKLGDAVIDSGYNAQEVYRFCMATGWKPFKGDQQDFYLVAKPDPRSPNITITVRQIWRVTKAVVYNEQTKRRVGEINLFTFCDAPMKDFLFEFLNGLIGEWTIPENCAREYMKQLASERREKETDKRGQVQYRWHRYGENHFLDCEKQLLCAGIITGMISAPGQVVKREQSPV